MTDKEVTLPAGQQIFAAASYFLDGPYCNTSMIRLLVMHITLSESRLMMVDTNGAYWFHAMRCHPLVPNPQPMITKEVSDYQTL